MVIGDRGLAKVRIVRACAGLLVVACSGLAPQVAAQPARLQLVPPAVFAPACDPAQPSATSDGLPILPIACTYRNPRGSFGPAAEPQPRTPAEPPPVVATPTPPSPTEPDRRFAYFPPGELTPADAGRGRTGDRRIYLPDIVYPIRLGPPNHAHMNSQIRGFGGHWAGVDVGGRECDPRNYDPMLQRDNYCEVRGTDQVMPLCPKGYGHRGQDIRPPKCEDRKWDVVAVVDGTVVHRSDWTMLTLKGDDGTLYDYLHMHPNEYRVTKGQRVRQGDLLGRVSKFMDSGPSTTIHLHFQARNLQHQYVPVFTSLLAAYRRSKGLDASVDANGNLLIDSNFEVGARRPDQPVPAFTVWSLPNVAVGAGRAIEPIDVAKAFRPADAATRVRYATVGLPQGLRLDADKGVISGDVDAAALRGGVGGLHIVKVTATDGQNRTATQNFVIRVGAASPMVVAPVQPRFVKEGVSILISAGSAFNTTGLTNVTYAATGLPPGFVINPRTGRITGAPTAGAATAVPRGAYAVTVTATDERGGRDSFSFPLTVERGPDGRTPAPEPPPTATRLPEIAAAMPEVAAFDGQEIASINAATYFKAGGDGAGALTFSAAGLPPVVVINPQTGVIEGTLSATASAGGSNGAYPVTVTARNAEGGTVAQTFVLKARVPPIALSAPTPNLSFMEGNAVDIAAGAAFTIPAGGAARYTAAGLPPGLTISPTSGQITGTLATGAANGGDRGIYTVLVTANDGRTTPVTDDFTLTIRPRPAEPPAPVVILNLPAVSVRAGAPITPLPTAPYFKAGGETGNALTYFADGLPPKLDIDTATGQIFGAPDLAAVTAASGGAYTVKITAIDPRAQKSVAQTFTLTVQPPAPPPPLQPPVIPTPPQAPPIPPIATPPPPAPPPVPPVATPVPPPPAPTPPVPPVATPAPTPLPPVATPVPPPAPPPPAPPRAMATLAPAAIVEGDTIPPIETAQAFALGDGSTGSLLFSARDLPWGLSIDGRSGRISGTVSASAPTGPYNATVMATDSASNLSASQPLAINVAARPAPPPPAPPVQPAPTPPPGVTPPPVPASESWWAWIKRKATGWF